MQGGPHDNNTAAKAICFAEALEPSFKTYAKNVVKNAKTLANTLMKVPSSNIPTTSPQTPPMSPETVHIGGATVLPATSYQLPATSSLVFSGGTDNHLLLVDVTPFGISGKQAQEILDTINITVNKQMLPGDTRKPSDPSGIRLGTPAMTTRGFGTIEFEKVGQWIIESLISFDDVKLHRQLAKEVTKLCKKFPLPN